MKELSIKEKAKAYDKALEMAKKLIENEETNVPVFYVENIKDIFPELKESEDEKIRKDIISYIKAITNNKNISPDSKKECKTWISWLEKQGEQKPLFKVGDKIRTKDAPEFTYTILEIKDGDYICNTCDFGIDNPNLELVEE